MAASCRGDAPISWVPATHCRTSPSPCGEGDLRIVLNGSAVPLCGPANTSLRHFNRTMKRNCLQKLAQSRKQTNASSSPNSSFSPYRLLFTGVSNMFHTWHAAAQDTMEEKWPLMPTKKRHAHCKFPDLRSEAFEPAIVDYMGWAVVSVPLLEPDAEKLRLRTSASCWAPEGGAFGEGGGLEWLVQRSIPYDAIAVYVGPWDASFTNRNASGFEAGLERSVSAVIRVWPETRLILFTMTPCGGDIYTADGEIDLTAREYTPSSACKFVSEANHIIRRVVRRHESTANIQLLDAHQMATSRPGSHIAGPNPGIWVNERHGWHFEYEIDSNVHRCNHGYWQACLTKSCTRMHRNCEWKNATPHLAGGEMYRAMANRVFDMICPHLWI